MKRNKLPPLIQKIVLIIKTGTGFKLILFFCILILLSSIVVFLIERNINQGFLSFFDSLWWTIVTISTVGYGDTIPISTWGRIIAIVTIFVGIGITGTVTGRIASFLMERQMKEEKGLLDFPSLKGHFIICGWKREMNRVLYDVLSNNPDLNPMEIVLLNKAPIDDNNALRNDPKLKGIKFINGNPVEEMDMIRAGARGAARVLIMADYFAQGDIQQIDSKTVIAVMTIKNLNKKAFVCAELLDTKFQKYLKLSLCDEILLSRDFSRSLLASASSGSGLSHVINALVAGTCGTGITISPFPHSFIGKTFEELKHHYYAKMNAQLIGMLENTGNILERKKEALREAQMNPDISKLIPEMKNVKTLVSNDPVLNPPRDYIINKYSRGIIISNLQTYSSKGICYDKKR